MIHIETQRPMKRVKYTKEPSPDGKWLRILEDRRVVTLEASFMYQNFGPASKDGAMPLSALTVTEAMGCGSVDTTTKLVGHYTR